MIPVTGTRSVRIKRLHASVQFRARRPKAQSVHSRSRSSLCMQHIKPEIISQTVALWQPRSARTLGVDDARQILDNTCGFFDVLAGWMRADQRGHDDVLFPLPLNLSAETDAVKRLNPRRVKVHRNYTVEEVAKLFQVHKNTVRDWLKVGLPTDRWPTADPHPGAAARELYPCAPGAQATTLPSG